jgi:ComF family protein
MGYSVRQFIRNNLFVPFTDFIYPPVCYHCDRPVASDEFLCERCFESLSPIRFGSEDHRKLQREILSHAFTRGDCFAGYVFEPNGVLQTLMHALKYQQRTGVGIELGKRLGSMVKSRYGVDHTWLLIPVPLYPANERERGFNQSAYIARGVAEATGADVDIKRVIRIRRTKTQTQLRIDERRVNVAGAFAYRPGRRPRKAYRIAVIDDVITTGSTVAECMKVIRPFHRKARLYAFSVGYAIT